MYCILLIINKIIFHLRNTAYGLGNGNYGKEEDGACLLLPEESGRRARRSAIRKNEKGISPILAGGTGKRPLYFYCSEVLSIQNRKAVWLSPLIFYCAHLATRQAVGFQPSCVSDESCRNQEGEGKTSGEENVMLAGCGLNRQGRADASDCSVRLCRLIGIH